MPEQQAMPPAIEAVAETSAPEWRVIAESVAGASHWRAGIPNQDAVLHVRASSRSAPLLVSLSDGHGSDKCFRSDRGSRFAVRQAAQIIGEFLDVQRGASDPMEIERATREQLPALFVAAWRAAVDADLAREPFTAAELERLVEKDGAEARQLVEANPSLAYGATSLTVAVEDSFVLYFQLGDGDILTISATGAVARALPDDERLFANETTSLCAADATRNFRARVQPLAPDRTDEWPALILVTTDGYANSFADEAGFLQVGADLLAMLRADGFDAVGAGLGGWLEEATQHGSGDDTTVAILCRMTALQQPAPESALAPTNEAPVLAVTPAPEAVSVVATPAATNPHE